METARLRIPYFPGCTLNTTAKGFDASLRASAGALGVDLVEMPEWNCCGATFPLLADNILDLTGPASVLVAARELGERVAVACTTCYNVLRRTNLAIQTDEDKRQKLNLFLEAEFDDDLQVVDILQVLRDEIGFEKISQRVARPLVGLKVAAYYGCMVLRPASEVAYDDPENPRTLDELLIALGAESVEYPHKSECCGSYLTVVSAETSAEMTRTILSSAEKNGAQLIATNCPLCQFNLDSQQAEISRRHSGFRTIPVMYFSQLLGIALGLDADDFGWERHSVDPRPILDLV